MSVLLSSCCCTGSDPCDTEWDFWNCCSGSRMYTPSDGSPSSFADSLGVSANLSYVPAGPFIFRPPGGQGLKMLLYDLPTSMSSVGGRVRYGVAGQDFEYFGAKSGNWGPASGSGTVLIREQALRDYGQQFPNSFSSASFEIYAAGSDDQEILAGSYTPLYSGQYDRMELFMLGPDACSVSGCSDVSNGYIAVSSSAGGTPFQINFSFPRGTNKDGGLSSDCEIVDGAHPDFCPQCPQDLAPVTRLVSRPQHYVLGNACGMPANVQAIVEASDPGSISGRYFPSAFYKCTGSEFYFGACTDGWYIEQCEDQEAGVFGTWPAGYAECSCCPGDNYGDKQVSLQVIT